MEFLKEERINVIKGLKAGIIDIKRVEALGHVRIRKRNDAF